MASLPAVPSDKEHSLEAVLARLVAAHDQAVRADDPNPHGVLERRAVEALAIHHEHRARDLGSARQYAQSLRSAATGRLAAQADHRLTRLNRKIVREEEKGGPKAAWLLENPPGERG